MEFLYYNKLIKLHSISGVNKVSNLHITNNVYNVKLEGE